MMHIGVGLKRCNAQPIASQPMSGWGADEDQMSLPAQGVVVLLGEYAGAFNGLFTRAS